MQEKKGENKTLIDAHLKSLLVIVLYHSGWVGNQIQKTETQHNFAHRLTSNLYNDASAEKVVVYSRFCSQSSLAGGVTTRIYCIPVAYGEARFSTCTVEAPLSCLAVILNPPDLFNQKD